MIIADRGILAESIAKSKAEDGWPYPQPGEAQCAYQHDLGEWFGRDRCALRSGHELDDIDHYSGPGQVIWTRPKWATP